MSGFRRFIWKIKLFFYGMWGGVKALTRGLKALEEFAERAKDRIEELNALSQKTDAEGLYFVVGRALTTWSMMEGPLVIVLACLLRVTPQKAGVVLYSIHNFNTWIQVINDLFEMDETLRPFQKRFNKINERIRRLKDQRDQLAHHSVKMTVDSALVSASSMDARTKSRKQRPLTSQEVLDFTLDVLKITQELVNLNEAMQDALKSSLQTLDKPATDQAGQPGFQ